MNILLYLILTTIVIFIIHLIIYKKYENFTSCDKENVKKKFEKATNEIKSNKNKWKTYTISKNNNIYYLKSKDDTLKIDIKSSPDKSIFLYSNNPNWTKGFIKNNILSFKFKDDKNIKEGNIKYSNTCIRSNITIKSIKKDINDENILGYSGFPGEFDVENNKIFPIIYEDGGTIIGFMNSNSNDTISVNIDNKKYLPLFFMNYVFINYIIK